ncbi:MAG: putative Ig domain-containing protein [Cyclobacteriaceae bacterium]
MKSIPKHHSRSKYYLWIKLQRRYRNTQAKWTESQDSRIARKLDILSRKIQNLNRKWKLGIAASVLTTWLAAMPTAPLQAQAFPQFVQLSSLDGSDGFAFNGYSGDEYSGYSVSGAGDVNGDGIDDILIGAKGGELYNSGSGITYVIFGEAGSFPSSFALGDLYSSGNGFVIEGNSYNSSGYSVSSAGDVNGDGFDDILIGAPYASVGGFDYVGLTYVVFGKSEAFDFITQVSDLDGTNGFVISGAGEYYGMGTSVSNAGDVNGDGIDDILIGASGASDYSNGSYSGKTYVVFGDDSPFAATFSVDDLDGTNGFVLVGEDEYNFSGSSVSSAGDVNGDGIDDILIGAPYAYANNSDYAGKSYVVFGKNTAFAGTLELGDLDGTTGFVINGIDEYDYSGGSVSSAGDINGDGIDDVLIGAKGFNSDIGEYGENSDAGATYVVFGKTVPFSAALELSDLDGTNGFVIEGAYSDDYSGSSVSGAGDVNGDGLDDILIGAYGTSKAFVVFGSSADFDASINLYDIDGSNGFVLFGYDDETGRSVSNAGDINGDGIDDLLIGAPEASPDYNGSAGQTFVMFGHDFVPSVQNAIADQLAKEDESFSFVLPDNTFYGVTDPVLSATLVGGDPLPAWLSFDAETGTFSGTPSNADVGLLAIEVTVTEGEEGVSDSFNLTVGDAQSFDAIVDLSGLDGTNGFVINGIDAVDVSGYSISGVGDINGDGLDDVLIGAKLADPNGNNYAGEVYIVFGKSEGNTSSLDLSSLDGTNGFLIEGLDAGDRIGARKSGAGDINGDGINDLLIGSYSADANGNAGAGETYVIFGKSTAFSASFDLSTLDGATGFIIDGVAAGDRSGSAVSSADINDDGADDILIGANEVGTNGESAGAVYVVFGKTTSFLANMDLSSLDGTNGFVIDGIDTYDYLGKSISNAGDINGDGIDDIIIGSAGAYELEGDYYGAGEVFVVFGKTSSFGVNFDLSTLDGTDGFVINGIDDGDYAASSISGAGDVNGDGVDDLLVGAFGADIDGKSLVGETFVVFGKPNGSSFSSSLDLSALDGTNGFKIKGIDAGDWSGRSVSSAGDMNNDGVDDILIGASRAGDDDNSGAGETYVVYGKTTAFAASIELSDLDGTNGFTIKGISSNDHLGWSVSSAGDMNGDELADIVIGADNARVNGNSQAGKTFVLFGIQPAVAPVLVNPIANQLATQDQAFSFEVPSNSFEDPNDNDVQTLSAALDGGGPLPEWLSFDSGSGTFSGTPANEDVGTISVEVTNTDEDGMSVSDVFDLEVADVNDAPILAAIGEQSGDEQTEITFTASASDIDLEATLAYSIDEASELKGMIIDEETGVFNWTPGEDEVGTHDVTVTVSDGELSDEETVTITVNGTPNTWNGTEWSDGSAPLGNENARISGDYYFDTEGVFEVNNLEIDSEATLVVNDANTLIVNGDLTNDGALIVESGSSLITYDANTITGSDYVFVRNTRYADGKYSFVGTPVEQNATTTGASLGSAVYRYEEFQPYSTNDGLDRWIDANAEELIPGAGYTQAFQQEITFIGKPNNGTIIYTGSYTEDLDDANEGWNLVSNPYPAAILIDNFLDQNLSIAGAVYIWDDNNSETARGSNNDYIVANEIGATDNTGEDNEARYNFHLGSSQGFFVKLLSDEDTDVSFTEDMRVAGNNEDGSFFRQTAENIPLVRLNLTNTEGLFKQTIIGWPTDATDDQMHRSYDAPVFNSNSANSIYSIKLDTKLSIQGVSDERVAIDLGFSVDQQGNYQLSMEVEHVSDRPLWVHDRLTDQIFDLNSGAYDFASEVGSFADRFVILTEIKAVLANSELNQKDWRVYAHNNVLHINPSELSAETSRTYSLYNLSGKFMMKTLVNQSTQIALDGYTPGVYLISDGITVTKIIVE